MAKKKQPEETRPKVDNPHVKGLSAAVVEQPITDTLETNYMPNKELNLHAFCCIYS